MQNVRRYADFIASIEGLAWLGLAWSISISMHRQSTEPTLAMLFVVATLVLFSWAHRPMRYLLRRYHIRKRRTDMWIHTLALPLLLAMFFHIMLEALLGSAWLPPKMLLFNLLASAGWMTFVMTLFIKFVIHSVKTSSK
ncbi:MULTISPECIES: hypothetical protein [Halomonadaceae]|jgi:cyanate permease|uniref:Transmembrane protein n=2 Tax=Vreelandella TaxID=3137766 RepID=A0A0D7UXI0_9GAMM|nr:MULTISPECIES: hypothetical protein [Halomonas]KTG25820.1 hypothetical protein AUR68_20755 [Idiomarina sp. H105]MEC9020448.1 hypothetical protein [Pseudomonadota bacterium]OAE95654.1 hypothetical protein AWR38_20785 [Idiomarina sp. WRN-38]KJD18192.1 hypothetical protein VE30_14605 [Halomonas meridiana]MAD21844.1 hypothetical protein [Halomonas sp.]|tara:strand:- start:659 stop:1075 length:417 start_codon:yes stop_codon:yes gene_type:complete